MQSLRIEAVTPQTLPQFEMALQALSRDLGDIHRMASPTLEQALFGAAPACRALVALDADHRDEPLGAALFSPLISTTVGGTGAFVSDLWVADRVRSRSVGIRLLREVLRQAETLWQARFIRLANYDHNPRAMAFYRKLGFDSHLSETILTLQGAGLEKLKEQ